MPKRHRIWNSGELLHNAVGSSNGAGEETSSMESIPEFRRRKGAIREGLRPVEAVAGDFIVNSVSQKPRDESAVPKQFPWAGQSGHDSQGSVGPDERFFRLEDNDGVDYMDIQSVAFQQGPGEIGLDGSEVEQPLRIVPQYPTDPDVAQGAMSVVENCRVVHGPSSLRKVGVSKPSQSRGQFKKEHSGLSGRFRFRNAPRKTGRRG
jgi:hypothetical protein